MSVRFILERDDGTSFTLSETVTGVAGVGVPVGGTTRQALRKTSDADYATGWADDELSTADTGVGTIEEQLADSTLGDPAAFLIAQSEIGFIGPSVWRVRKFPLALTDLGKVLGAVDDGTGAPKLGWTTAGAGSGDVVGPASSTDEAVARFDGTTGKLIQNSVRLFVADAGTITAYPSGMTAADTTDSKGATAFPNGTTHSVLVLKSPRPETRADFGVTITATDNPGSTTDDVTVATGFNVLRNPSLPMIWRATENLYYPDGTGRFEDHVVEGGHPAGAWWLANSPRRAISVEIATAPIGAGGVVNVACDTDTFRLESGTNRRRIADGGSGGPTGEYLRVSQSVTDADTRLVLTQVNPAGTNDLTIQLHPTGGYTLFETSRDGGHIYFRPTGAGNVYLGSSAGSVQIQGGFTATNAVLTTPNLGTPSAGVATNLTGTASGLTAGVATTVTTANEASDTTCFVGFVTAATGNLGLKTNAGLTFDSSTGILTATGFAGPLTGNVTGNASGSSGSCTGNAATATALQTARTINGTSFDGTANITVTAAAGTLTGTTLNATVVTTSITSVGTITSGVWNGTDVAVADGGTGASTAAGARSNLGVATISRGLYVASPADGTITLEAKARFAGTIDGVYGLKTSSGTLTLAIQINGTNVTSLSGLSVISTPQDVAATGANTFAVGDRITAVITSSSSPANLEFSLQATR